MASLWFDQWRQYTLSKIANEDLGNAGSYMKIFELNKDHLSDPDMIKPGQVLRLP